MLLFAAFLLLLGLTTATAASFDVQAEDIASFTTDVSISVPTRQVPFYLKNGAEASANEDPIVPGLLDRSDVNNSVHDKELTPDLERTIRSDHLVSTTYHAWETADSEPPFAIDGPAILYISSNGGTRQITAGLFECWVPDPGDPVIDEMTFDGDTGERGCILIDEAVSTGGSASSGFSERTATFNFSSVAVEPNHRLRVKIINRTNAPWKVQWGNNPARPAQLLVNLR